MLLMQLVFDASSQSSNSNVTYDPTKALMVTFGAGGSYNDYKNLNNRLDDAGILTVGKFAFSNPAWKLICV